MVVTGTTKTGFDYSVDLSVFNNMRVLEGLTALDDPKGNPFAWTKAAIIILGKEQYDALVAHLENLSDNGIAEIPAFRAEFLDIMTGNIEGKK